MQYYNYIYRYRGAAVRPPVATTKPKSHLQPLRFDGLIKSTHVRIRKTVNYAGEVPSLEKFNWMHISILTCKSFVLYLYGGERLIELSSSWFLSKFPSG